MAKKVDKKAPKRGGRGAARRRRRNPRMTERDLADMVAGHLARTPILTLGWMLLEAVRPDITKPFAGEHGETVIDTEGVVVEEDGARKLPPRRT